MTVCDASDTRTERIGRRAAATSGEGLAGAREGRRCTGRVLLDKRSESVGVSALKRVDDALVLEEQKCWHGTDTVSLCDWLNAVDIDFEEDDARVLKRASTKGGGRIISIVDPLRLQRFPASEETKAGSRELT